MQLNLLFILSLQTQSAGSGRGGVILRRLWKLLILVDIMSIGSDMVKLAPTDLIKDTHIQRTKKDLL